MDASGPDPAAYPADEVQQMLLYLGSALTAAGEPINEVTEHLSGIAAAYGHPDARFAVLPTFIVVALDPASPSTLEPTPQLRTQVRLDQISKVDAIVRQAKRGAVVPAEASADVVAVMSSAAPYRWPLSLVGFVLLAVGICLLLRPTAGDLVLAVALGALVGAVRLVAGSSRQAQMVLPFVAALLVGVITFELTSHQWADADLRALVAPLVTFIPGAVLTTAVIELAAGELITGASRLVSGSLQMALLAFGIIAATTVVGLPSTESLEHASGPLLGAWSPWLGVLVYTAGVAIHGAVPHRSVGWLLLALLAAHATQVLGNEAFGGYAGAFLGAVVVTILARAIERTDSGPPMLVTFLPAFWLLAPGTLGLIGITEYLSNTATVGLQDFTGAIGTTLAIALGALVATPISKPAAGAVDRWAFAPIREGFSRLRPS